MRNIPRAYQNVYVIDFRRKSACNSDGANSPYAPNLKVSFDFGVTQFKVGNSERAGVYSSLFTVYCTYSSS